MKRITPAWAVSIASMGLVVPSDWPRFRGLDGVGIIATPAISNGRIFVRTEGTLYVFAERPAP